MNNGIYFPNVVYINTKGMLHIGLCALQAYFSRNLTDSLLPLIKKLGQDPIGKVFLVQKSNNHHALKVEYIFSYYFSKLCNYFHTG